MAVTRRSRGAQYPLVAEYVFNYNDGAANLSALNGASVQGNPSAAVTDFGSGVQPNGMINGVPYVASGGGTTRYFEVLALPVGAQIIGGDVHVESAYVGPATAALSLGNASSGTLYASAVDVKTAARTALTIPVGTETTNAAIGSDIRMTLALGAGNATQGRVLVRVMYTIEGRMNEVSAN
jgi:hypothetical protein